MYSVTVTYFSVCSQLQVHTAVHIVNYRYSLQCI